MDIFAILNLIGGLCLFLFGMNIMGSSLEKRAGSGLTTLLGRLTGSKAAGFLTGLAVTAVIQSSSATTVMVVGFVNSGIMTLKQAINVIMGANVGTTVTAWLLSLTGIESSNIFLKLLKPTSFTPILALIGIIFVMGAKSSKKKDTGMILLGFATLMFGMDAMSDAVSGLKDVPQFQNILLWFSNPILGVLAGAVLTAIIQSSSASVGILQALSSTGQVTFGAAIPIIMGQNIGTCVTALISSVGATTNARRAAIVHLCFNIIGTIVWLTVFCLANAFFDLAFVNDNIDQLGIAVVHTVFNLLCTATLLPLSGLLEKLACKLIPDPKEEEKLNELDERLMATPSVAIDRCKIMTEAMAVIANRTIKDSLEIIETSDFTKAELIRKGEGTADHYEDILGTYLVRLGTHSLSDKDTEESGKLLHLIGDLERITDHSVNILESAEEIKEKGITFSEAASAEMRVMCSAISEIIDLAVESFLYNDLNKAELVEPLEEVIDSLKNQLRNNHIMRLQRGSCSIEAGFVLNDLLTNLERVADHCSNIAGCVIEMSHTSMELHEYLESRKAGSPEFNKRYKEFSEKYALSE